MPEYLLKGDDRWSKQKGGYDREGLVATQVVLADDEGPALAHLPT